MKNFISLPIVRSSVSAASLFALSAVPALADVTLKGSVGARVIDDDVVIARNTRCVMEGTLIKGNIRVLSGAKLIGKRIRVDGNVQAFDAFLVDLRQGTRVEGDVQGEGTRSIRVVGGTRVSGNVQLTEGSAPAGVDALLVSGATVEGDVQAEKSSGRLRSRNSTVDGNLQFVENRRGPYLIRNNSIDGDLQFFKNQGSGTITDNTVKGNLQSKENRPAPVVTGNRVEGDLELE
ncbi:MAG: hypothetical protein V4640_05575 [Verrucomicrobiota bacterium]